MICKVILKKNAHYRLKASNTHLFSSDFFYLLYTVFNYQTWRLFKFHYINQTNPAV